MNRLFVYYSETGNGDVVANSFEEKGYDIIKLEIKNRRPKSFFFNVMFGGFEATIKKKAKLKTPIEEIEKYDDITIGCPIWNDRFSTPINALVSKVNLSQKKVKFVFYSGSGNANHAIARIAKELPDATYVTLKQPKDNPEELKKL